MPHDPCKIQPSAIRFYPNLFDDVYCIVNIHGSVYGIRVYDGRLDQGLDDILGCSIPCDAGYGTTCPQVGGEVNRLTRDIPPLP